MRRVYPFDPFPGVRIIWRSRTLEGFSGVTAQRLIPRLEERLAVIAAETGALHDEHIA